MNRILIIDDDRQLRMSFSRLLSGEGYQVTGVASGEEGLAYLEKQSPALVFLDVRLPGMNGLEVYERIRRMHPKLPVIIMTAFASTETAIQATRLGAFDYILKPFEVPEVLDLIARAIEAGRLARRPVNLRKSPDPGADVIIGQSRPMQEIYKAIGRVAATDATVLIRGESGTGKELVARALYQHSLRADKPFLVINCVAIPENLLESELFGYEKGAFTGAGQRRYGKIEQAHGGTVLLDEIGDMPLGIQSKILRLLQEKRIERLGGNQTIPVDVRILAATNRDLEAALADSRFREDLYYRLKVVTITLPPLRERPEDIPLLVDYFLDRFSREMDVANPGLTDAARASLVKHPWPGNVRELANAVQKALIFSRGCAIDEGDAMQVIAGDNGRSSPDAERDEESVRLWVRSLLERTGPAARFSDLMERVAAIVIEEALDITGDNRTHAARLLGVSRPNLVSRISRYRLNKRSGKPSE
jgi:DNA-binding NtrC family response regulator